MSRIYFHSPRKTVEVYGAERHWLGQVCANFAAGVFKNMPIEERIKLLPTDFSLGIQQKAEKHEFGWAVEAEFYFDMFLRSGHDDFADGNSSFHTILNTCLVFGNSPIFLAALIHGQCEVHGFIEDESIDREWFADTLEYGMDIGVFRRRLPNAPDTSTGWPELVEFVRSRNTPIVSSYSVSGGFPKAGWTWAEGMKQLRELHVPPRWREREVRLFGHGTTAMDYAAQSTLFTL